MSSLAKLSITLITTGAYESLLSLLSEVNSPQTYSLHGHFMNLGKKKGLVRPVNSLTAVPPIDGHLDL
jgi:uncharacterized protein with NAD-binding domain and iron-sulfur cluster